MDNLEFYPDPNSKLPLYKQLYNHIKTVLSPGKLPAENGFRHAVN